MKRVVLILLSLISVIYAYQWPSNPKYIERLFGAVTEEKIYDGVEFNSEGQTIYPVTHGEVVFYEEGFLFGENSYWGSDGNILILRHSGDFNSIYRNFETSEEFNLLDSVNKNFLLGTSKSGSEGFIFSLYDEIKGQYINPEQILPRIEDEKRPVIKRLFLEGGDGRELLRSNMSLASGYYKLYIDAYDILPIDGVFKVVSPFQIYVFIDGLENYNISFASIKEKGEKLYITGSEDVEISHLIKDGMFYGGELYLTAGKSVVEVVVRDIVGNEASRSIPISVSNR